MADEGLITREEAVARVDASALDQLLHPTLDPRRTATCFAKGLPAAPGAASGKVVFTADAAEAAAADGAGRHPRPGRDQPEDIHGMHAAQAAS